MPYPWLERWCDEVLRESNAHYWGLIERRMALTALQGGGSVAHADQYCKMRVNAYAKVRAGVDDASPGTPGGPIFQINNLIPRPEPLTVTETVPALPPATAIPVLEVRR